MNLSEHVRTLLHKAAQDEAVLAELAEDAKFDDETVGFHAQQAAEKLLKAWLSCLGVNYPKTHRLETLIDLLNASGKFVPLAFDDITRLTPFATAFRYDEIASSPTVDRRAWLPLVRKLRAFVETQIGASPS